MFRGRLLYPHSLPVHRDSPSGELEYVSEYVSDRDGRFKQERKKATPPVGDAALLSTSVELAVVTTIPSVTPMVMAGAFGRLLLENIDDVSRFRDERGGIGCKDTVA